MSGSGQAKAKKKSAKKAVANSTPAAGRPQTDFIIENVRCFAGEQRVPIRPITLLVGGNSTGKTTFLGCLNAAFNLLISSHKNLAGNGAGFNTPPFSMGGFRDIARRPPGKKTTADEFRIGFVASNPDKDSSGSVVFSFGERDMEAVATKISLVFPDGGKFEIAREKSGIGTVSGPGFCIRGVKFPSELPLALAPALMLALFSLDGKAKDGQEKAVQKARAFLKEKLELSGNLLLSKKMSSSMLEGAQMMSEQFAMAFAPGRSKPKRTYNVLDDDPESEGGRAPQFMFRLSKSAPEKWRDLRKRLIAFGKEAGMFSDFNVISHGPNSGGDFHLEVETRGSKANIADVGYGVSQAYPLLVPIMRASQRKIPMVFLLQEPEIHLHPQAQAALTSFFAKTANEPGRAFAIETHGDAIIDRVRICVSNGLIPPEDVVILYFEPQARGNVKIHPIEMDKMANLRGAPKGYRDFFMEEDDRLLGFKKLAKV